MEEGDGQCIIHLKTILVGDVSKGSFDATAVAINTASIKICWRKKKKWRCAAEKGTTPINRSGQGEEKRHGFYKKRNNSGDDAMTCRKEQYRDLDKFRRTIQAQKKRYYAKTAQGRSPWHEWQDDLILKHEMTDHELSELVGHSVKAIQIRRSRLKNRSAI